MPEKYNHEPLFVGDIVDQGQTSEAVAQDIIEARQSLPRGVQADIERAQKLVHKVSLDLLGRLNELGVEEADKLKQRLAEAEPSPDSSIADMTAVSHSYFAERSTLEDPEERDELKRLEQLSDAVGALASARAMQLADKADTYEGKTALIFARERVYDSAETLSNTTQEALTILLEEVQKEGPSA